MEWYVDSYDHAVIWYLDYPEYKKHNALDLPVFGFYSWFTQGMGQWKGIKYVTRVPSTEPCSKHGIIEPHRYCSECGVVETY